MKDKLLTVAACLIFLVGAAVFCYPLAMNWYYDYHTNQLLDGYKDKIEKLSQQTAENAENIKEARDEAYKEKEALRDLYKEMEIYNETIYENKQKDLTDPFSYESASFDLTAYGLSDNIIGYLTIPAMEVELPIYLGANNANLAKGAVHLGQTSMPIGGINTNVVLAAHRGYRGIPMFREIEKLKTGDTVTLTTPWDILTYQVSETEIILPDEIDKILIQPGQDMLTLLTCHPYRQNSHRYVVYCKRVSDSDSNDLEDQKPAPSASSESSNGQAEIRETDNPSLSSSREQILIDKYVPIAGILFLLVLFVVCMIKMRKKCKGKAG